MKYFTLLEFCRSEVARHEGLSNIPSENVRDNIYWFVENVLDPIREIFGHGIVINSGYRSIYLNNLVGGKSRSYHTFGLAADIRPSVVSNTLEGVTWSDFLHAIYNYKCHCVFGSYIDIVEYGSFVHIEFDARKFAKDNHNYDFRLLTYKLFNYGN